MPASPRQPLPPLPGDLLVAAVGERDSTFSGAVIAVLECDESGALGVVLNDFAPYDLDDALPGWEDVVSPPQVMFCGGPVEPMGALCLARRGREQPESWRPVFADVGLVSLEADPTQIGAQVAAARVFGGYSGWAPGQLSAELDAGLWHVVPGTADDVFCATPEGLWRQVLRRSRGEAAFFSTWTDHPERN